jgi:hypothetical protein
MKSGFRVIREPDLFMVMSAVPYFSSLPLRPVAYRVPRIVLLFKHSQPLTHRTGCANRGGDHYQGT